VSTVPRWGRCQLLEVGFDEIRLLVSRPPRTAENAQRIAAEHVVFDEGFSRVLDIAASLMETHELNPVEPVWSHLKRSLANMAKRNLTQLTALVKTRLRRMQYRPALLEGFLASTGLDLTPICNPHH
jgi:hypothetical protein